jgi:inorganic triphosphatase YgiF
MAGADDPHEIERQWIAPGLVDLPDELGGFRADEPEERVIVDTYFDTAGGVERGELSAAGASLRLRDQNGARLATFKQRVEGDSPELRRRREIEVPVGDEPEQSGAWRAARELTSAPLVEIGRLENRRTVRVYREGGQAVEVALDVLRYPDGSGEHRLEAEGEEDAVQRLAQPLAERVPGLQPALTGKLAELLRRLG